MDLDLARLIRMDLDLARLIRPLHAKTLNLLLGFTRISSFMSTISALDTSKWTEHLVLLSKIVPSFSLASKQSNAKDSV
jgi:hypothetical protein